ncbi:MAG: phosphosulfolactate synthase [Spirulina sp.]
MLDFLELPQRSQKPRKTGITHVIDRGIGMRQARDLLETSGDLIDFLKLGWGIGYLTENLTDKIKLYQEFGLTVYFGGTLFEVSLLQNKLNDFRKMLQRFNIRDDVFGSESKFNKLLVRSINANRLITWPRDRLGQPLEP